MEFIRFIFSSFWVWAGSMVFMFAFFTLMKGFFKMYLQGKVVVKHGYRTKTLTNKKNNK